MVGRIPVVEGFNAGASYSVAQLMLRGGDVAWAGTATRLAKNLGVAARADVQAIVDAANAETAVLRNEVIGTQSGDIRRDPTRLSESAMGNLVADAMRARYPGVDAALTNSGGLRADLPSTPPSAGEAARRDHLGRGVRGAALRQPHGDRDAHRRRSSQAALLNGVSPACNPAIATGRFPQVSGLQGRVPLRRHDGGASTHRAAPRRGRPDRSPRSGRRDTRPHRHQRLHVHRRRRLHGPHGGTDVLQPGDALLDVVIEWIGANTPVAPVVEGRITRP